MRRVVAAAGVLPSASRKNVFAVPEGPADEGVFLACDSFHGSRRASGRQGDPGKYGLVNHGEHRVTRYESTGEERLRLQGRQNAPTAISGAASIASRESLCPSSTT